MKLYFDQDILLYMGLFAVKDQGYFAGLRATDNIIYNILDRFDNPSFELVISGSENFRKTLSADYKANRKPESKPPYLYESRQYYKKFWEAVETDGCEADDYIASNATEGCVIISNDHDYKQIGVPMFNPRTWEYTEIANPDYWWWLQMLTGCRTDNVKGLINPEKRHHKDPPCFTEGTASKLLEGKSPEEMKDIVQGLYKEIHGDNWFAKFDLCARLLYLRRKDKPEYYQWLDY